jgi:hypothetical protein
MAGGMTRAGFLERMLQSLIGEDRTMAYIDKEDYAPIWLPQSLPQEILTQIFSEVFDIDPRTKEMPSPNGTDLGFVARDWFGPFFMGPHSLFLRGRC